MKDFAISLLAVALALLAFVVTEAIAMGMLTFGPTTWDLTANYVGMLFASALVANLIVLFSAKRFFAAKRIFRVGLFVVTLLGLYVLYLNATGNPMVEASKYLAAVFVAFAIVAFGLLRGPASTAGN